MHDYFFQGKNIIYFETSALKMYSTVQWDIDIKVKSWVLPQLHTSNETVRRSLNTSMPLYFSYLDIIMPDLLATSGCKKSNQDRDRGIFPGVKSLFGTKTFSFSNYYKHRNVDSF